MVGVWSSFSSCTIVQSGSQATKWMFLKLGLLIIQHVIPSGRIIGLRFAQDCDPETESEFVGDLIHQSLHSGGNFGAFRPGSWKETRPRPRLKAWDMDDASTQVECAIREVQEATSGGFSMFAEELGLDISKIIDDRTRFLVISSRPAWNLCSQQEFGEGRPPGRLTEHPRDPAPRLRVVKLLLEKLLEVRGNGREHEPTEAKH